MIVALFSGIRLQHCCDYDITNVACPEDSCLFASLAQSVLLLMESCDVTLKSEFLDKAYYEVEAFNCCELTVE